MSRIAKSDVNNALKRAALHITKAAGDDGRTSRAEMKDKLKTLEGKEKALTDMLFRFVDRRDFKRGAQVTDKDVKRAVEYAKEHMVAKYDLNNNGLSKDEIKDMSLTGKLAVDLAKALKEAAAAGGTGELNPLGKAAVKTLQNGYTGVAARIHDIQSTMMRALLTPAASAKLERELAVLQTTQGGLPAVEKRLKDIEKTLTTARLTADGKKALDEEAAALGSVKTAFGKVDKEVKDLKRLQTVAMMTPEMARNVEARLLAYGTFNLGAAAVTQKIKDLEHTQQVARLTEDALTNLLLQKSALKGMEGGIPALDKRMQEIRSTMMRALMTPEASVKLETELNTLSAMRDLLNKLA